MVVLLVHTHTHHGHYLKQVPISQPQNYAEEIKRQGSRRSGNWGNAIHIISPISLQFGQSPGRNWITLIIDQNHILN